MLSDNQLEVGFCTTEHQSPCPGVQEIFQKLYHRLVQPLSPTSACKLTERDCAKILTKLKQNNSHCSSLDISSQKVISYSAIHSSGISIFWSCFWGKKTVQIKVMKKSKHQCFRLTSIMNNSEMLIKHKQHFTCLKKCKYNKCIQHWWKKAFIVLIPLPWNCTGHQGTLSQVSGASSSVFLPWDNR